MAEPRLSPRQADAPESARAAAGAGAANPRTDIDSTPSKTSKTGETPPSIPIPATTTTSTTATLTHQEHPPAEYEDHPPPSSSSSSGSRSRSRSRSPSPSPSALRVHPTTTNNTASTSSFPRTHSLVGSYPRTSFAGSRASLYLNLQAPIADKGVAAGPGSAPPGSSFSSAKTVAVLSDRERSQILRDELALLADNNIVTRPQRERLARRASQAPGTPTPPTSTSTSDRDGDRRRRTATRTTTTENTPLLRPSTSNASLASTASSSASSSSSSSADRIDEIWDQAVMAGKIRTSYAREAKVLASYTAPLILTFLLEYSLTVASIFAVGHIGKVELGAVSLASMTANITGYGIYQGLTTALDTLCSQAYGSGRKELVGLHVQRMVYFTWLLTVPIGLLWYNGGAVLKTMVPDEQVAEMAGRYLRVVLWGAPGFALFESAKRFVQAQGLFQASMYVLLICAPLNGLLNYLFVWEFGFGYIGAPMAVAITNNLMPLFLFLYVYFFQGRDCWYGFSRKALTNWGPMVSLALPGLCMVESETLAFEILTLSASWLGTTSLAAQSVLATLTSITFQIPFPLSVAGSTRLANLIGAELPAAACLTSRVMFVSGIAIGAFNLLSLCLGRNYIPYLFTSDAEVARLVADVLPVCASFQVVDAMSAICNGILRGVGRQSFGGYVQLISYYVIALPISFVTAFVFGWGLYGVWAGVALGLAIVSAVEIVYIRRVDWDRSVKDARVRNSMA